MMRAVTVEPGTADSVRLEEIEEPAASEASVIVQTVAVGICGTDHEIIAGKYGEAPPGERRLVIGHESVGRVLSAPPQSGLHAGDWVIGIVRRPDPVPCTNCAAGEWDMCRNGRYTEHGIKGLHGFARERFTVSADALVRGNAALAELNVLVEPASVVAKAWEHITAIGSRAAWKPSRVLITGAGPIGMLAALGGVQRGLEVHVYDRVEAGPKPDLIRALGAHYHTGDVKAHAEEVDVVLECTGAPSLFFDVMDVARANGIICLTGVSSGGHRVSVDAGLLNRELVLENNVVFGSVNANRRHYEAAVASLANADRKWLNGIITRRVPLDDWAAAYAHHDDDVKTILKLA